MANSSSTAYQLPRNPRVWWSRIKYRWPFLVWVGTVALVIVLYLQTGRTVAVSGVVEVISELAAPVESARLVKVEVRPGLAVRAGDVLAEFDTALLDAETKEIEAKTALDQLQTERQFGRAVSDAEARLRELKLQQAIDQNRLDALREQFKGMDLVVGSTLADARAVAMYRADEEALAQNVKLYPEAVRALEADLEQAHAQLENSRKANAPDATRDLVASLKLRKENYVLRARHDGIVSRVLHAPGDVVSAADPVVTIVANGAKQVIGFMPEAMAHDISVGDHALVTRAMHSGDALDAHVTALGPEILGLPTRVSPVPGQTVRGRRVVLAIDKENDFLPGEGVNIYLSQPWWMEKYQKLLDRYSGPGDAAAPK